MKKASNVLLIIIILIVTTVDFYQVAETSATGFSATGWIDVNVEVVVYVYM